MTREQVDVFKGWAILQVVVIHMLALFPERTWQAHSLFSWLMIAVDQIGRLSIPLFIFLSWFGLSMKYRNHALVVKDFVVERLGKLLPLYLIWSVGLFLLMRFAPRWLFAPDLSLTSKVLFGQADYQLYFIPLIVMLYLLFIVFFHIPKVLKVLSLPLLFFGTWWWFLLLPNYLKTLPVGLFQPDQLQYLFPITWLWYAWFGGTAAEIGLDKIVQKTWARLLISVAALVAAGWLITTTYQAIHSSADVLLALRFTKIPVLVFASLGCIWVMTLTEFKGKVASFLQVVGRYSFLIFLAHTMVIRLTLSQLIYPVTQTQWLVGVGGVCALIVASWFIINRRH